MAKPLLSKDQIRVWESRLIQAYKLRQEHEDQWRAIREYYKGNYFVAKSHRDRVAVNKILSTVRQVISALYFQNPRFYATGKTVRGQSIAPVIEGILPLERDIMDAQMHERRMLQDALLYGTGILKHGWNAEFDTEFPWADPYKDKAKSVGDSWNIGAEMDGELPQGGLTERNANIHMGHPWKTVVHPWNFLIDPDALDIESARWFCHVFNRPWLDVVRDARYDKQARKEVVPTGYSKYYEELGENKHSDERDRDSSLCTLYEIYDRESNTVVVLKAGIDRPLLAKPYPFYGTQGPYEVLRFIESDDDVWGISYSGSFSDQVEVLNLMRTQMMNHLQRWGVTRGAYLQGTMDPEDIKRFSQSRDGDLFAINGATNINDAIQIFPSPPISADAWNLSQMFSSDLDEISGVNEMARGGGKNVNTATEASIISQQQGLRVGDMRFLFERALIRSARRDVMMLRQFWGPERVVPIVGPDGQIWAEARLTASDINAEYEIYLEPGSTERVDKNVRARQTIDAIAQLTPLIPILQQQGWTVNMVELVKAYLRNVDVVRNPERLLMPLQPQPQPPPGPGEPPPPSGAPPAAQPMLPTPVNNMDQMPTEGAGFDLGRMFSESLNGAGGM